VLCPLQPLTCLLTNPSLEVIAVRVTHFRAFFGWRTATTPKQKQKRPSVLLTHKCEPQTAAAAATAAELRATEAEIKAERYYRDNARLLRVLQCAGGAAVYENLRDELVPTLCLASALRLTQTLASAVMPDPSP
jgi:hypothetical protein